MNNPVATTGLERERCNNGITSHGRNKKGKDENYLMMLYNNSETAR